MTTARASTRAGLALTRARAEDSTDMEAETALRRSKTASSAVPPAGDAAPNAWLPIDGVLTVDETAH